MRRTVADLLEEARSRIERLSAAEAAAAAARGALLLDIRTDHQRERDGVIPDALHHPRNVLEWRADPASELPDPALCGDLAREVIVVCHEGYQSSLAAAVLRDLGYERPGDMIGGFQAWQAAGLPVETGRP